MGRSLGVNEKSWNTVRVCHFAGVEPQFQWESHAYRRPDELYVTTAGIGHFAGSDAGSAAGIWPPGRLRCFRNELNHRVDRRLLVRN